jgi:hypothetical protein
MAPQGFGGFVNLPVRGDGFSERQAKKVLRSDFRFQYETPEEWARGERELNVKRWTQNMEYRDTLTEDMLFEKPQKRELAKFSYTDPLCKAKTVGRRWMCGYWGVMLMTIAGDRTKKYDWQIDCLVAGTACVAPSVIRQKVVGDLGEDTYERFKQRQWSDMDSLKWCLNEACQHLNKDNSLALSWVTSPSSARLLEKLEVRVERDWAFLFGHYTWK